MLRKKDVLIIVAVLLAAALAWGGMMLARRGQALSGTVQVYAQGELYAQAPLDTPGEIRVEQPDGTVNVIAIEGGGVRMAYSSCRNQSCVEQGEVTGENWTRRALGRSIICLPNHVMVELALDEGHPSLEEEDVADI